LCGPFTPAAFDVNARPVFAATTSLCGLFKVPTLRNIAITAPYFHNGVLSTLRQVIEWYVTRDINNNDANNPNPVAAGPGGNPYQAVGTFYTAANGTPTTPASISAKFRIRPRHSAAVRRRRSRRMRSTTSSPFYAR
jgi:cytochrome c peroxidase